MYTNSLVSTTYSFDKKIVLVKLHVKQVEWNQLTQHDAKSVLVNEFLFCEEWEPFESFCW